MTIPIAADSRNLGRPSLAFGAKTSAPAHPKVYYIYKNITPYIPIYSYILILIIVLFIGLLLYYIYIYLCASLSSCLAAAPQASGPSDDPRLYMVKLIQVGRPCFDDQQTRPQRLPLFSVRASIAFVSPCPCKHGTCVPASMAFVITQRPCKHGIWLSKHALVRAGPKTLRYYGRESDRAQAPQRAAGRGEGSGILLAAERPKAVHRASQAARMASSEARLWMNQEPPAGPG